MTNPEFKRNLWLSFSRHKLIGMPALLGLTFFAVAMAEKDPDKMFDGLYSAAIGLFIFIVWLWGARNANLSIVDELRDKTWDQQRMSALGPWAMTWGKLFGSTSFNWYGGAFCLAVAIGAGIAGEHPDWAADLLTLVAAAVLLHAGLMALNLHSARVEMQLIQRGGLAWVAIIFALITAQVIAATLIPAHTVSWWGIDVPVKVFLLDSAILFAACAVFSAWRVISNALQVRTIPWAWPLFGVILTVYLAGLADSATDNPVYALSHVGLLVCAIMTYATLFSEPARLPDWNRLRVRQQRGDWRGWLQYLPLWPTTLLLAFCFALLALVPVVWPSHSLLTYAYGPLSAPFLHVPIVFALMLLRDAGIVLFFSFSRAKRPAAVALLYIVVLDALLPFLFAVAHLESFAFFFRPFSDKFGAAASLAVTAAHAVIALGLVAWRLQGTRQLRPA